MKTTHTMALAVLASAAVLTVLITILYDAFGTDAAMKKDWGFSALVEVAGKRISFDTGNDGETFAANVKAKGVDLTNLDFVILSHRHSDHMAGLGHVLTANPKVKIYAPREGFGIFGSSLPSRIVTAGRSPNLVMRGQLSADDLATFVRFEAIPAGRVANAWISSSGIVLRLPLFAIGSWGDLRRNMRAKGGVAHQGR